ncbi:MAG: AIPR protein [Candidatus Levybacteria bacterium RBG_16_35_11]|nr:MAG: AIPR protein [Candidatus Levybacteria bacterium RBG_16_35_11]
MTYEKIYDRIKDEIRQDYYQQNYPNDGQRFIAWYLRNIHLHDQNETKADITDGADDKQIDAIVIDDNNNSIYIIQGKFIGADKVDAEPLREVLSSWIQLKDLVRLQETGNTKLKQRLSELSIALDDGYDIHFELLTTATLTPSAKEDLATFQTQLAEVDDFPASIHLVDNEEILKRYEMALDKEHPIIKFSIQLEKGKYIRFNIGETQSVIAAIPLKNCLDFPGIKDGTLFKKNVRQSLGLNNRVNKGIKDTIYKNSEEFFFYHNGITTLCTKLDFNDSTRELNLNGLSVVNGCQSLTTILSCSEKVKQLENSYIMFRFYEINNRDRADRISINTNSQSAVKPRDLRSNDKRVLSLKKVFEQKYPTGYLITKRGEEAPAVKDKKFVLDLSELGKFMIAWQSQRPNIAYSETKIFDKYFDQLFKKDYSPDKIQALNEWMTEVWKKWIKENPLGLNESLLAMKAYAPYHHLYAISVCFGVSNQMPTENVPNPYVALKKAKDNNILGQIIDLSGRSLSFALESAANEPQTGNKVFSPQNWIKTKTCLAGIRAAVSQSLNMMPMMNPEIANKIKDGLKMEREDFEARWTAD